MYFSGTPTLNPSLSHLLATHPRYVVVKTPVLAIHEGYSFDCADEELRQIWQFLPVGLASQKKRNDRKQNESPHHLQKLFQWEMTEQAY